MYILIEFNENTGKSEIVKKVKPYVTLNPNFRLIDLKKGWKNQKTLIDVEPNCDVQAGCFL